PALRAARPDRSARALLEREHAVDAGDIERFVEPRRPLDDELVDRARLPEAEAKSKLAVRRIADAASHPSRLLLSASLEPHDGVDAAAVRARAAKIDREPVTHGATDALEDGRDRKSTRL